jgi:hypothetical protein
MQKVTRAALLCSAALLLSAAIAGATPIDFHITVNTSSLVGNSAAPFALDFQLNGGNHPTNPAFGDALVLVDISTPAAGVRTFSGTGTFSGVTVTGRRGAGADVAPARGRRPHEHRYAPVAAAVRRELRKATVELENRMTRSGPRIGC